MKFNSISIGVIAVLMVLGSADGEEIPAAIRPIDGGFDLKPICDCFDRGATSIDLFGAYVMPHRSGGLDDSLGGGIALTKYKNSYLGFSVGAYWWDGGDDLVTSATASVIFRYPLRTLCVAPYAVMGFGGDFGSEGQVTGHLGAGIEIRVPDVKNLSLFIEGTYTWANATENYAMFRLGTRYEF